MYTNIYIYIQCINLLYEVELKLKIYTRINTLINDKQFFSQVNFYIRESFVNITNS